MKSLLQTERFSVPASDFSSTMLMGLLLLFALAFTRLCAHMRHVCSGPGQSQSVTVPHANAKPLAIAVVLGLNYSGCSGMARERV